MKRCDDERGITLLEMLVVLALMGLVFGGVVAFSTGTMSNFHSTTQGSLNQQVATQIMNQLEQDLRRSDPTDNWVLYTDHKYHLHTARSNDDSQTVIEVTYEVVGREIFYTTVNNGHNVTVALTKNGKIDVQQNGNNFTITVEAGAGNDPNQAVLTSTVSRYNWRP